MTHSQFHSPIYCIFSNISKKSSKTPCVFEIKCRGLVQNTVIPMDTRKKELIIKLIQQDLKHNQLTGGLQKIGLKTDVHHLELVEVIMALMDKSEDNHQYLKTYFHFLNQAANYKITATADNLKPLAEKCYKELLSIS
jgi:hypothetical protein